MENLYQKFSDPHPIPRPQKETQKQPVYEDIDKELLVEQKKQSAALEDGLSSVAHEVLVCPLWHDR